MEAAAVTPTLQGHLLCIRCGYDLHGQDDRSRCPECGLSAFWSMRAPEKLSHYPPQWVTAMSWAARLLAVAYGVIFAVAISVGGQWVPETPTTEVAIVVLLGLGAILQCAGAWMLAKHSRHFSEPEAPVLRWMLRVSSSAPLLSVVVAIWWLIEFQPILRTLALVGWIGVITPIVAFVRLGRVAKMISEPILAEHSRIVGWGFLATMLALPLAAAVGSQLGLIGQVLLVLPCVAVLLLFFLWGAFVMFCCVVDFRVAVKIARAEWKQHDGAV